MVTMMSEKREIRPVFIKFGVALAFSLGGILYTLLRNKKNKPSRPPSSEPSPEHRRQVGGKNDADAKALQKTASLRHLEAAAHLEKDEVAHGSVESIYHHRSPSKRSHGDKDAYLLPEFNDLLKDFDFASSPQKEVKCFVPNAAPVSDSNERREQELEIKRLRSMVSDLTERERSLEVQLLEYYGLKEQETAVMELQNRLKINTMESKLFNLKIQSLMADKKRLEGRVADHAKVVSELEAAKAKIRLLRRKLRSEAEQNRERILALKDRVDKMQDQETKALTDDLDIQLKLHKLKELEEEAKEPQESNENLKKENEMLSGKLEYLQSIASYCQDEETEALSHLSEERNRLRIQNEDLSREIEQIQAARCSEIEELVYLRWINACLRYELRNYQADPGKTSARDLSRSLSPKSEEKAKQLILEYASKQGDALELDSGRWSSSSNITEEDSLNDVSSSSASKPTKHRLFGKLMRLLRGKGKFDHELRRSSSLEMTPPQEDSASHCSSGVTGTFIRSRNSSHNSSRLSLDLQRLPYHLQEPTSEDHVYKMMNSDQASKEDFEKSELVKYADALRESRRRTPATRKRSASVSSF